MTTIDTLIAVSKQRRLLAISSLVLIALSAHAQDAEDGDDLFKQIQSLQSRMNIQITGLERIQNEEKVMTSGSLEQQIEQLLASFNHIISRNAKGQIEHIVIINKKQKPEANRIVLPTSLQGNHFMVSVAISGNGRVWQTLDMIIDTGADLVVLPESMIDQLGLADSTFTRQQIQTANGMTEAKIGMLQELKIAGETVENVEAAFIADDLLGKNSLLGMSVLGRYQLTIDDKTQLITLFKKQVVWATFFCPPGFSSDDRFAMLFRPCFGPGFAVLRKSSPGRLPLFAGGEAEQAACSSACGSILWLPPG
jgi:clan AA aspartic protease (TIGR02281 family)